MKTPISILILALWTVASQTAFALPTAGQVVSGNAQIIKNYSTSMTVAQTSSQTIINWQGFNISQGDSVNFLQPNASVPVLNRILGTNGSMIFENLTSNGRVILISPNRIRTGTDSVGGLCLTASNQEVAVLTASGKISRLEPVDPTTLSEEPHKPANMIYGLFNVQVQVANPGDTAIVTILLPNPAPADYKWFKYLPGKGWYDFSDHTVFSEDRMEVTLTLTDGGIGDDDGVANGLIVDPSGLGTGDAPSLSATSAVGNTSGGGCFIATAAYGSPLDHHVVTLRMFRDRFLMTTPVGRAFVRLYYHYSPPLAAFIAHHDTFRLVARVTLLPLIFISWIALNYGVIALLALVAASCGTTGCVGVWWCKRNGVRT